MSEPPARKPRSWLDAVIAASLRWNDRLGRTVGAQTAQAQAPQAAETARSASPESNNRASSFGPPARVR